MTALFDASRPRTWLTPARLVVLLLLLLIVSQFLVIVPAGERGVLLRFGAVQDTVLGEGLHPVLAGAEQVRSMSVRLQSLSLRSEAASRDLQDVAAEVTLSWHLRPERVAAIYRQLGDEASIVHKIGRAHV